MVLPYLMLAKLTRYTVFAVIIMVVWVILNILFCMAIRIFPNFKKPPDFKSSVLIMGRIKSIEWLDIDTGMLKLMEKIVNHF